MAVVSSCSRTTRGRSSILSAHAGKGRSLTLEHAHRTAAAMAQICLKQGNQGARSPKEAKEFQDQKTENTLYRASPPQLEPGITFLRATPPLGLTKGARCSTQDLRTDTPHHRGSKCLFPPGSNFSKKSSGVRHQQKRGTPTTTNFSRRVKLTSPKRR